MAMARTSAGDGGELSSAEARQLSRYSSGEARVNYELKSLTCRDDNGRRWKENEAALATQVCVYYSRSIRNSDGDPARPGSARNVGGCHTRGAQSPPCLNPPSSV